MEQLTQTLKDGNMQLDGGAHLTALLPGCLIDTQSLFYQ